MTKRARIHPSIAVAAIVMLGAIAVAAKVTGQANPALLQEAIVGVIALIVGIKVRVKLPIT